MQLSVLTVLLSHLSFDEALKTIKNLGINSVEIACGGYPGKAHCDPKALLNNKAKFESFKDTLEKYDMKISALAVHGNPIHPQKDIANQFHDDFVDAVLLAEKLSIDTLITFSGCPGDSENSLYPNWIVCPWPADNLKVLEWQWNEKLIPYWTETSKICKQHNIHRIAFEMHPSFCVYNPETLLKLREAVGDIIGANFDPSHLIWQGINPVSAIKSLNGVIYHFHAKDTKVDNENKAINGVLDTKNFANIAQRSWVFRTVGYGNSNEYWKDIISALQLYGYDRAISIEHEDGIMSPLEGLKKAVNYLKDIIIYEQSSKDMWWA